MSDIVDRLNLEHDARLACGQDWADLLLSAAGEIERLRARVAELDEIRHALGHHALVPPDGGAEPTSDLVRNLVTRVAELEAAQEWRPIETAPRGRGNEIVCVLLVTAGDPRSLKLGYWDAYYASGGRGYDGGDGWVADEAGEYRLLHDGPTHWRPLPAPPKVAT